MSQEKVDRYKEQKKNRKAIQAKKKEKSSSERSARALSPLRWYAGSVIPQWTAIGTA